MLLSISFNGLFQVVISLKSISHLVHWIHLFHFTLYWPSSSTLFVALTLGVSVTPRCYHCKLIVIVHGPLWRLLLSVTIPCREREPITRLVNFLLTSESIQSKPYSLSEAYLKAGLPGWWALLNCNLALNCVSSPKHFSSHNCEIESACLIGLAK
jgi:hypothetical protein